MGFPMLPLLLDEIMKKVDYQILAEAIKKHRDNALGLGDGAGAKVAENIARTFARFAHVDKAKFLLACGIKI